MSAPLTNTNLPTGRMRDAKPEHEAFYQDLCAMLTRHVHLSPEEMLAVTSNFLGRLVAMQDQRRFTPATCMEIVAKNIEAGNQRMVVELAESKPVGMS